MRGLIDHDIADLISCHLKHQIVVDPHIPPGDDGKRAGKCNAGENDADHKVHFPVKSHTL